MLALIIGTVLAVGALAFVLYPLFAGTTKKNATDRIELGPAKVLASRLAMGTGTNGVGGSSNQKKLYGGRVSW